jgi:hypothetical protein
MRKNGTTLTLIAILILSLLCPVFASPVPQPDASSLRIMTWVGISPEWQRTLHISGLRMGCSSAPQSCMKSVSSERGGTKVFLAVLLKPETVDYAQLYSALSLWNPSLVEIGLDDFVSQYYKLYKANAGDPSAILSSFIDGIKSRNPKLQFGATIYENDLGTEYLGDKDLPPALRARFDMVHFFVHYRGDSPKYKQYIRQLKTLFPNAQIVGGIYAYDRISYLPCLPNGQPCSVEQEMNYFNLSLDAATNLLKQGAISWMEIFPGVFGREAEWSDWKNPKLCSGRISECVANTQKMDQAVVAKIKQLLG